jgi:hypothetical protein
MSKRIVLALYLLPLLTLTGCMGSFLDLPPVELELDVIRGAVLDPAALDGAPEIAGTEIYLGEFCDVPTVADVEEMVREELGDIAGGLVNVRRIDIDEISLTATEGSFDKVSVFGLGVLSNLRPHFLGLVPTTGATNKIAMTPPGNPDLLDILPQQGNCIHALATLTGEAPEEPVTLDITMKVTVRSALAF